MARIKYYYDTQKCKYERVKTKPSDIALSILGFLSVSLLFSIGLLFLYHKYFPSPQETILMNENEELVENFNSISEEIEEMNLMLHSLQDRDAKVYRMVTGADSLPESIRNPGIGGAIKYQNILEKGFDCSKLIVDRMNKVDELKRKMYIQTKSYDDIIKVARKKEEMLASMPAIQPVSNKELKRLASGYGLRIHPIYKVKKMHWGTDFSAPKGTPVYATGDGVVKYTKSSYGGYGKHILIDHGFGYQTQYAHLQRFVVKSGEKVKRGELIGYVGNTGSSTAPHLHYEVIHNGKKVNPIHYFFNDLDPEQYEQILKLSSIENQSLS